MIYSIKDLRQLVVTGETNWKQYGEVITQTEGDLILFDYSSAAQFARRWNYFEQVSRGLVLRRSTGEVMVRPFDKFYNWGECTNDSAIIEVTEKMDGSLGLLLRHEGQTRVITRGSFNSKQAQWATQYLNTHHNLAGLDPDLTLLWEIIYAENRVVVNYGGWEGLVLIGARERSTGRDYYYRELEVIADQYGFPLPKVYRFDYIGDVLMAAKALTTDQEGWVVRFADGERLKIKGEAYRLAHRILTQVTFGQVLYAVKNGQFEAIIAGVPDEFLEEVREYKQRIDAKVAEITTLVQQGMIDAPTDSRAAFAAWVRKHHAAHAAYFFAALDDKPLAPLIYKHAF
jgi:RNA ligase